MAWTDILKEWKNSIPKEERVRKVINVIKNFFQHHEWKSGTHIKVTDERLLYYKKKLNTGDDKVAPDGSFQIIAKSGRTVPGLYIKRLLYMVKIIELYEEWQK